MDIKAMRKVDTEYLIQLLHQLVWVCEGSMYESWFTVAVERIRELDEENRDLRKFKENISAAASKINKRR